MTASAIRGDREKCLEAGMNNYLAKPVRAAILKTMLEEYLGQDPGPMRTPQGTANDMADKATKEAKTRPALKESDTEKTAVPVVQVDGVRTRDIGVQTPGQEIENPFDVGLDAEKERDNTTPTPLNSASPHKAPPSPPPP